MNFVAAACYLCNSAEAGELWRNCACTGPMGFLHYPCLRAFAIAANASWDERASINAYLTPWNTCSVCHQTFQGRFSVTTAVHHVQSARENFCGTKIDRQKQIEAKFRLMSGQMGLRTSLLEGQILEVMATANVVMEELIGIEGRNQDVLRRWLFIMTNCFQAWGVIVLMQGRSPEHVRVALNEYRFQRQIVALNCNQEGFMHAHRLVEYLEEGIPFRWYSQRLCF